MNGALVVIDIRESFRQRPLWQATNNPDIVDKVNTLVAAARADDDLVVWVLHAQPGSGGMFDPVSGHVRYLGGLDLDKYCKSLGHHNAVAVDNSASGWRCLGVDGTLHQISITDACNWQFLDLLIDGITVYAVNTGGLGGWRCASDPVRAVGLGGMDLTRHCQALGYSHAVLLYRHVSGWRCQASNGTQHEFSMHAACRTNNPSLVNAGWSVVSTFGSVSDAFGIKCAALRNF